MKELENQFEQVYREYKNYEAFYNTIKKSPEERRKETAEYVLQNKEDEQSVIDKVFESGVGYLFYEKDLQLLRDRLVNVFKFVEGVLEIPQEIKTEINSLQISPQFFIVDSSLKAIEVDQNATKRIKEQIKKDFNLVLEEAQKELNKPS